MAKIYIRFHYTFSHGCLWLKSISDFTILFSHGCTFCGKNIYQISLYFKPWKSVAKNHVTFHYTFSHGGLWLKSISDFTILTVATPGLIIGGGGTFEGQTHILGGKIEFLKRYCYLPMPLSQDFCPPPSPGDSPPSQKWAIFLGIPHLGDEYPRNIAPPPEGRMTQEYRPP